MKHYLLKLLLLVAIVASGLSASAGSKIYLLKSSAWSTTAIWAWVEGGANYTGGTWPGQKMSVENIEGTDYFYWEVPDNAPAKINIIFNNNNNGSQTNDITNVDVTEDVFYKLNGTTGKTIPVTKLKSPYILDNPAISVERNVVTIKASADGGNVYYTLDGTEPTNESTQYTGPFTITEDVTVKAIQMKTVARSEVVSLDVAWKYYCDTEVPAGIYYAGEAPVEICSSDTWLPVEGGTKASGQPDALYLVGNIAGYSWDVSYKCEGKRYGTYFVFDDVELAAATGETHCFFSFVTKLGNYSSDWDTVNGSDRYGAAYDNEAIVVESSKKYTKYTVNVNASAAKSWKVEPGTYRFEVNFAAGTVLVTQKPAPAFAPMAEADTEAAGFKADGKTLYKADVTAAKVAFRSGEAVSEVFTPDAAKAYIYTAAGLEEIVPVSVGLVGAADGLMSETGRLVASDGTLSARYSAGEGDDAIADELHDGEAMLNPSLFAPNALVELAWEATSSQGLTFTGTHSLVTPGEKLRIYAKVPEGWGNLSYSMISDVNEAHTAEGVFSEVAGDYLVITVPAHLIYSQVTFYDGAPVSRAAGDSFTYPLAGKTMYFEDNGKFWNENTLDYITGVEAVEAAGETEAEYFNLQGIRIAAPSAGVYIRRCGTKVSKVFIAE